MPDPDVLLRGLREVINAALAGVARRGGNPIGLSTVVDRTVAESGYAETSFGRSLRADMLIHRADVAGNAGEFDKAGDLCFEAAGLVPPDSIAQPNHIQGTLRYATLAGDATRRDAALQFIARHLKRFDWQACQQVLGEVCDPGVVLPEGFRSALFRYAERAGATPRELADAADDQQLIQLVYRRHGQTAPTSSSRRLPCPPHGNPGKQ